MPTLRMTLENQTSIPDVTVPLVQAGLRKMASPHGPTYIILQAHDGAYIQAAGTDGRYVIEAREVFGEGFVHRRAATRREASGIEAEIYFRNRCVHKKHAPRRCPVSVDAVAVIGFDEVVESLLLYARSGERTASLFWLDVSAEFLHTANDAEFKAIRPRRTKGEGR